MGFEINDSTKTSLFSPIQKTGPKPLKEQAANSYEIGQKLLNYSKIQISQKTKKEVSTLLKKAEQQRTERIKQRNSMKAKNGLTWQQTQDKIKAYREKYLPKKDQNTPVFYADSPYKDYVYAKQEGGTVKFYVDERKYITDQMSQKEKKDFEKTMTAYDELYHQNREIAPNGCDITSVKYPSEVSIAPKEPPEGYNKMYV